MYVKMWVLYDLKHIQPGHRKFQNAISPKENSLETQKLPEFYVKIKLHVDGTKYFYSQLISR